MLEADSEFSAHLRRFRGLGRADRKAVLAQLSAEELIIFEKAVEADDRSMADRRIRQQQADRQYRSYSPWLADLVEAVVNDAECRLTPVAAKVIAAEHKALIQREKGDQHDSWSRLLSGIKDVLTPHDGHLR